LEHLTELRDAEVELDLVDGEPDEDPAKA